MVLACVHVKVKPEYVEDFIRATEENHRGSVAEAGNFRFDVCRSEEDPTEFLLYEAYTTAEAAAAHKKTPHYSAWRDAVAKWMAEPRRAVKYRLLFPEG